MTILITGASGQLGRLVVERLLARGVPADGIVAGARDPEAIAHLGVRAVALDYEDPASVTAALDGVDRVLLISSNAVGRRAAQHRAVIDAAAAAGVELFAYTSLFGAVGSPLPLAAEHIATEQAIAEAGLPAVLLRNDWYTENYAGDLARAAETGEIASSIGAGRVSSASRIDYADAAAVVLTRDDQVGRVHELAGDTAWTADELAAAMGEVLGREVVHRALTTEEHVAALEAAGLDAGTAGFVAALDAGIAAGGLESTTRELSTLIGRPTTPLVEGLRALV